MTQDDISRIEAGLGLVLPRSFVRFMLNYLPELRTTKWTMKDDEGNHHSECPADYELSGTAEAIIALNRDEPERYHYSARLENWPESFLIIGQGGCGEVYAINAGTEDSPVYRAEPSSGFFDPTKVGIDVYFDQVAPSLAQFAENLLQTYRENPYFDDQE
jgi:hypothetical protein